MTTTYKFEVPRSNVVFGCNVDYDSTDTGLAGFGELRTGGFFDVYVNDKLTYTDIYIPRSEAPENGWPSEDTVRQQQILNNTISGTIIRITNLKFNFTEVYNQISIRNSEGAITSDSNLYNFLVVVIPYPNINSATNHTTSITNGIRLDTLVNDVSFNKFANDIDQSINRFAISNNSANMDVSPRSELTVKYIASTEPQTIPPVFPSNFYITTGGTPEEGPSYKDAYGRIIDSSLNNAGKHVDYVTFDSNPLRETITIKLGDKYPYHIQTLWNGPSGSSSNNNILLYNSSNPNASYHELIYSEGYLQLGPDAIGPYKFYVVTTRGHVELTIEAENNFTNFDPLNTITLYAFKNKTILLDPVTFLPTEELHDEPTASATILKSDSLAEPNEQALILEENGHTYLKPTRDLKLFFKNKTYNINIVSLPTLEQEVLLPFYPFGDIRSTTVFHYLPNLFEYDERILFSAINIQITTGGSLSKYTSIDSFNIPSYNSETNTIGSDVTQPNIKYYISIYGLTIGYVKYVEPVDMPVQAEMLFTKIGSVVDIRPQLKGLTTNDVITDIRPDVSTYAIISGTTIKVIDKEIKYCTCDIKINNKVLIEVVLLIGIVSRNSEKTYIPRYVPDGANLPNINNDPYIQLPKLILTPIENPKDSPYLHILDSEGNEIAFRESTIGSISFPIVSTDYVLDKSPGVEPGGSSLYVNDTWKIFVKKPIVVYILACTDLNDIAGSLFYKEIVINPSDNNSSIITNPIDIVTTTENNNLIKEYPKYYLLKQPSNVFTITLPAGPKYLLRAATDTNFANQIFNETIRFEALDPKTNTEIKDFIIETIEYYTEYSSFKYTRTLFRIPIEVKSAIPKNIGFVNKMRYPIPFGIGLGSVNGGSVTDVPQFYITNQSLIPEGVVAIEKLPSFISNETVSFQITTGNNTTIYNIDCFILDISKKGDTDISGISLFARSKKYDGTLNDFIAFSFEQLPKINTPMPIYYADAPSTESLAEILPLNNYTYYNPNFTDFNNTNHPSYKNVGTLLSPNDFDTKADLYPQRNNLYFSYGEIVGKVELIKFDGEGFTENIFIEKSILVDNIDSKFINDLNGPQLHIGGPQGNVIEFKLDTGSGEYIYQGIGFTISLDSDGGNGIIGFTFTKEFPSVNIPQIFLINNKGSSTISGQSVQNRTAILYSFENITPINKTLKIYESVSIEGNKIYEYSSKPLPPNNTILVQTIPNQTVIDAIDNDSDRRIYQNTTNNTYTFYHSTNAPLYILPQIYVEDNTTNEVYLLSFENLPAINLPDIHLYLTKTWYYQTGLPFQITPSKATQDIGVDKSSITLKVPVETAIVTVLTDPSQTMNVPGTKNTFSEYNNYTNFSFNIKHLSPIQKRIDLLLLQGKLFSKTYNDNDTDIYATETDATIIKYASDPTKPVELIQSPQLLQMNHIKMSISLDNFQITPLSLGHSVVYLWYLSNNAQYVYEYNIFVHSPPLPESIQLEIMGDTAASTLFDIPTTLNGFTVDVPASTNPTTGGKITVVGIKNGTSPSASESTSQITQGKNIIYYQYLGLPNYINNDFSSVLETELTVKVFPKPKAYAIERFVRFGEILKLELINEIFGETTGHSIVSVSSPIPPLPIGTLPNGGTVFDQTALVIDSSKKYLTVTVPSSTVGGLYMFDITYKIATPTGIQNESDTEVTAKLNLYLWNSASVPNISLVSNPDTASQTHSYANLGIVGDFKKIEFQGTLLSGTNHEGLEWGVNAEFTVKTKSEKVNNYLLYTTQSVYMLTVISLRNRYPKAEYAKQFYIASTPPPGQRTIDLFYEFFPTFADSLVEANIEVYYNTSSTPIADPQNYNISLPSDTSSLIFKALSGTTISTDIMTVYYKTISVSEPTLISSPLEFVFEIGKPFEIPFTNIALNADIRVTSIANLTNTSDTPVSKLTFAKTPTSFIFNVQELSDVQNDIEEYKVDISMTKEQIAENNASMSLFVYNPSKAHIISKTTYATEYDYAFIGKAVSYLVNNINYGLTNTNDITIISIDSTGQGSNDYTQINAKKSITSSHYVIVIRMSNAPVSILDITFVTPTTIDNTIYLKKGGQKIITYRDISNILPFDKSNITNLVNYDPSPTQGQNATLQTTPVLKFAFDDADSETNNDTPPLNSSTGGYEFYTKSGSTAGTGAEQNPLGGIVLTGMEPGVWENIFISIYAYTTTSGNNREEVFIAKPKIQTISQIVTLDQDIIIEKNNSINFNLQNFIVDGIGKVIFKNWSYKDSSQTSYTLGLPSGFTLDDYYLKSNSLTVAKVIDMKFTAFSSFLETEFKDIAFKIIITDPGQTIERSITLIENNPSIISFDDDVSQIDNNFFTGKLIINNVKISYDTVNGKKNLVIQAVNSLPNPIVISVNTRDGKITYLKITQVSSEKNMEIAAYAYDGNLFKNTQLTVQNYEIGSNTGTYLPGQLYTLPDSGHMIINTDGSFDIHSTTALLITVNIKETSPLLLSIGGAQHPTKIIVENPPPAFQLGNGLINVKINGDLLTNTIDLSYAKFILDGTTLRVSEITSEFEPTIVQYENITDTKVKVSSFILDTNKDTNDQNIYEVEINKITKFVLPFEPKNITYNTMILGGTISKLPVYRQGDDLRLGNIAVSGTELTVTTLSNTGITRPIGFVSADKTKIIYVTLDIITKLPVEQFVLGTPLLPPSGTKFVLLGNFNQQIVTTDNTKLDGYVYLQNGIIIFDGTSLTDDYQFYATTDTGIVKYFIIKYFVRTLKVSNIKKIYVGSFLGGLEGNIIFNDTGITIKDGFVINPDSLRVLHMISPTFGRFTLEKIA